MPVIKTGNILHEGTEALVNTVNCVGVMGRGIALQFKNAFPLNFKAYKKACERSEVRPGKVFVFETGQLTNPKYIINFPTKRHWRENSRVTDIVYGLQNLKGIIQDKGIKSIAVPPLGCGLGGLDWKKIRPLIEKELGELNDLHLVIFEPDTDPDINQTVKRRVARS